MASFKLIDIGANLTDAMFRGVYHGKQAHAPDLAAVLARAWAAGVERIIVTGGSLKESREALELADTDARLFCTVGVHPTRCSEFEESGNPEKHLQELEELAREGKERGKVVAIGECGLDYDRLQFCPAETQQRYFDQQFALAERLSLPMFLHMRAAVDDFCSIFHRNESRFKGGVAHSFTGSAEDLRKLLAFQTLSIGINGCSLKTPENLDVMAAVPVDRMLLETDSPYCDVRSTHAGFGHVKTTWPSKKKEKADAESMVKGRNEPCTMRQVLEVVAGHRGIADAMGLARTVHENTCRLFFPYDLDSIAGAVIERRAEV